MTESWQEAWARSELEHRQLQDRILAIPGSQRVLGRLTKDKGERQNILSLLAGAVEDHDSWRKPVRAKKRELESIANQLETVAKHAQRSSLDPSSYGTFWLAIMGMARMGMVKPVHEKAPTWLFGLMRLYAKNCRDRAKAFGTLLRDHPPRERRMMIDCLLLKAWLLTRKYHDKEVAFLLTNAFEAVGIRREFTEDQIKKHRQRYVVPRIKEYLRRNSAIRTPTD